MVNLYGETVFNGAKTLLMIRELVNLHACKILVQRGQIVFLGAGQKVTRSTNGAGLL